MSATNRGTTRQPQDFYETPYWCTRAILPLLPAGRVLDPCCGEGAILDVAKEQGREAYGIELDEERAMVASQRGHAGECGDALRHSWPDAKVLVTNPPYSLAMDFILRALQWIREKPQARAAAFLLRVNFISSQTRSDFHKQHPADLHVLPKRPSFILSVSCDAVPYDVFPGKRGCGWAETIPLLPTGEPRRERPVKCPRCGGATKHSSSDATEYAWYVWGVGRGGRWSILDLPA